MRIAESANQCNTLVVLPTGLGKTMIAMLVAAKRLEKYPGSKVLVLAPTRPLAIQHCNTFRRSLLLPDDKFVLLTGEIDPEERADMWKKGTLFFATPQTVYNDLLLGRVSFLDFVFIVFDEAHRSVKDYTYTKLAKRYMEEAKDPLILGLTASPGGSIERIEEIKRNLFISKVESRTEQDEDVKQYVEPTLIESVKVKIPLEYENVAKLLKEIFNEKIEKIRELGYLNDDKPSKKALLDARKEILEDLREFERRGKERGHIYQAIINQSHAVMLQHAIEVIETQGARTLSKYIGRLKDRKDMRSLKILLNDPRWELIEGEVQKVANIQHPKISILISLLNEQFSRKKDSKVIVFTQYRDTIDEIVEALRSNGYNAQRFVGQSDRGGNIGMNQRLQSEMLERFKHGDFNILVSSSIGEEGLHVPDVDLVVFYEAVPSEIRAIQRRGRTGRTREGRVVILLSEGTVDESYYFSSLYKEKRMRKIVKQKPKKVTLLDFIA